MEKSNTKMEILDESLKLFAIYGYEATSISMITEAVGIKKASLYFHFKNKQDILDTLVEALTDEYSRNSLFARADFSNPHFVDAAFGDLSPESVADKIKEQISYVLHNPHISLVRKLLKIEQFRNEELAKIQGERNYEDILHFYEELIKYLIDKKILKAYDTKIMAAQFAFPISMWLDLGDREPDREDELMGLITDHVKQFFEIYAA